MIKIILVIFLIFILIIYQNISYAAGITVDGHVNGFTTGDSWKISRTGTALTSSDSSISIEDLTDTNSGWLFTVNVTDFSETLIDDPSVNGATLSVNVDVEDWLSMTLKDNTGTPIVAGDIPATSGLDIPPTHYTVNNAIVDSGNVNILKIEPGYGAGLYDFQIDYTISLDDWLPDGTTITSSAASGIFSSASPVTVNNAVQKYQIFVGTYETTITYSVTSNPP